MKNLNNEENKNINEEQEDNKKKGLLPILGSVLAIVVGIVILVSLNNVGVAVAASNDKAKTVEQETTTKAKEKETTTKAKEKETTTKKDDKKAEKKEKATTKKDDISDKKDNGSNETSATEANTEAAQPATEAYVQQQPQTEAYVEPQTQAQPQQAAQPAVPAHEHNWVAVTHEEPVFKTVHHDAVTETVWVVDQEAWDETVDNGHYEYHTVCEECGIYFDNMSDSEAAQHSKAHALAGQGTGYYSDNIWVPNVQTVHHDTTGHNETKVVQAAWDEQVANGTQTVTDYYKCSSCGATK